MTNKEFDEMLDSMEANIQAIETLVANQNQLIMAMPDFNQEKSNPSKSLKIIR